MFLELVFGFFLFNLAISTENCFSQLNWSTENGHIIVNEQPLVLKGINYPGFENVKFAPGGLANNSLDFYLDVIKNNGFNAIRVPFSLEIVRNNPRVLDVSCEHNPSVCGATAIYLLDVFIHRAAERGLLILLDNHRHAAGEEFPPLWYDSRYSEEDVIVLWETLLSRYRQQWNVFAIDLKNDPHNADPNAPHWKATWGNSSKRTDWNKAAERMIRRLGSFPGLFFVGGIEWGNRFEQAYWFPINTGSPNINDELSPSNENDVGKATLNNRVVYSPHCYGPDGYDRNEFHKETFPANLDEIYMRKYGFLSDYGHTVVIGEWGGGAKNGTRDGQWNNWYVDWLRRKCLSNNFYWCLNPIWGFSTASPHIMGGLLRKDWKTIIQHKLDLVNRLQPKPAFFEKRDGKICITPGEFPEEHCRVQSTEAPTETTTLSMESASNHTV